MLFKIVKLKALVTRIASVKAGPSTLALSFLALYIILVSKILIMSLKISKCIIKPQRKEIKS